MCRVLTTGITGNVGNYIYKALSEMNVDVVGAVTSVAKSKDNFSGSIELVEFDFLDKTTFDGALKDVDRVFLMRPPHLGKPQELYPFIDAMYQRKVKLVVFLSLMGVEKNPVPPHHKIEKYIEKVGLPHCHIRPGFFMQNLTGIHAKEIKEESNIFIPAGKSKCSFIDTQDIGFAIAKILAQPLHHQNTAYTITGEESLDYYQIAEMLSEVLNRKITYSNPSWIRFRQYMIDKRKLNKSMVNVMVILYFLTRLGTASAVHNDFEKITGKRPRSFKRFAEENANAWL